MRAVLCLFALVAWATPLRAQQPLSRADSADVLVGSAERLEDQGSRELAEALARLVARRYADTPAAARANALLATLESTRASRSGRVGLIAFSTIYGTWLGIAVPIMADAESPEAFGLGMLTGAPLGFLAGRAYTRDRSVSAGDAGVVTWSGIWGTWQGGGWMQVLGDDLECSGDVCFEDGPDASETVGATVVGGLIGVTASAIAAHNTDVGGGTATMIGWGSLWGTLGGLVTAALLDFEQADEPLAASLIGGDVGFASMAVLAPRWDMSTGRAWLINAAGVMGGAIGAGIDLIVQPDDEDVAILIPTIGVAAGLAIGAHLTRGSDEARLREGMLRDPSVPSDALLRLRDGEWTLGLPQPALALVGGAARGERELGMRVRILDARF